MSTPPPPGVYVPAVLFLNEKEDFDVPAIKAHVLRLAKVIRPRFHLETHWNANRDFWFREE